MNEEQQKLIDEIKQLSKRIELSARSIDYDSLLSKTYGDNVHAPFFYTNKAQIEKILDEEIPRPLLIDKMNFALYELRVNVRKLELLTQYIFDKV